MKLHVTVHVHVQCIWSKSFVSLLLETCTCTCTCCISIVLSSLLQYLETCTCKLSTCTCT